MDYTPPANFTTSSGSSVVINHSIDLGVITYFVDPVEVRNTVAITAGLAAAEIARAMLQMQATAQACAFAEIRTSLGSSMMMGVL